MQCGRFWNIRQYLKGIGVFIAELPGSNATSAVVDCAAHLAAQDQAKTLEFNLVDQQMGLILLRLGHQLQSNGWALELRKIMRFRPIRH